MRTKFAMVALLTVLVTPMWACAENLTFRVRSYHENQVDVAFYSQSRNFAWPGGQKVYVISDYGVHSYRLNCIQGEKVCYGAWVRNSSSTYWGSGEDGAHSCASCCYICNGGETPVLNLNAR